MAAAVDVVPRSIASQYAGIAFPLPLMRSTLRGKPIRSALRKDADHGRRVGTVDIILAQYRPGNLGYRRNIPHIPVPAGPGHGLHPIVIWVQSAHDLPPVVTV